MNGCGPTDSSRPGEHPYTTCAGTEARERAFSRAHDFHRKRQSDCTDITTVDSFSSGLGWLFVTMWRQLPSRGLVTAPIFGATTTVANLRPARPGTVNARSLSHSLFGLAFIPLSQAAGSGLSMIQLVLFHPTPSVPTLPDGDACNEDHPAHTYPGSESRDASKTLHLESLIGTKPTCVQ